MPLYEYRCQKCGATIEKIQKFSDAPLVKCKKCGGRLERVLSAPAIQFKGSGWYATDFRNSGTKAAKPAGSKPAVNCGADVLPRTCVWSSGHAPSW